jgi:hypothetical protein
VEVWKDWVAFLGCLHEAIEFHRLDKLQNESDDDVGGFIQLMATLERDWIIPS